MWMLVGPTDRTVMLVGSPIGAANTNKQVNKQQTDKQTEKQTDKKNTNKQNKGKLIPLKVLAVMLLNTEDLKIWF